MGKTIIRRLSRPSVNAVVDRLTLDAYPADEKIEWRNIMGRVVGADCTLIEIGAKSGVSSYPMVSENVTNVGQSVQVVNALRGSGDYRLYAEFTTTTVGEMLELTAFGVLDDGS